MNAKIIGVWGASGSGKTTVSVNLALSLSERNCMVGIISSKLYYGEMQSLLNKRVEEDQGLLKVLTGTGDTKNMFVQAARNVFFLSTPNEFDGMLLSTVSMESTKEMLEDAAMRFDYLIIDGCEELNNPVSSMGLAMAAQIFNIHYPSVKGCAWFKAMENVMDMLRLKTKSVHVLNAYDKTCDKMAYMSNTGVDFNFELDFVEKAKIYENSGTPIYTQKNLGTKAYRRAMDKIASLAALS